MTEQTSIPQGPCAGCRHPESAHVAGRVPSAPRRCEGDGTRPCRCSGYDVTLLVPSRVAGVAPSAYYAGRFRSGNEVHLGRLGVASTACGRWTKYGLIIVRGAQVTCEQCLGAQGGGLHGFGGSGRSRQWAALLAQRSAPAAPAAPAVEPALPAIACIEDGCERLGACEHVPFCPRHMPLDAACYEWHASDEAALVEWEARKYGQPVV